MQIYRNIIQGTPEWLQCRLGIATASEFGAILAKGEGKTRRSYMMRLAAERVTGAPSPTYENDHMRRGRDMEAEARALYEIEHFERLEQVGFVRNDLAGCSPDSLIGDDGLLEVKTKLPAIMVECILRNDLPPEHVAQCQGGLWVCERERLAFVSYWPGLPLFVHQVRRDEAYIKRLAGEVARFTDELELMTETVRAYGQASRAVLMDQLQRSVA